jgi:hypothetical protein
MREMADTPLPTSPSKAALSGAISNAAQEKYGAKANVPAPYPLTEFDLANRVAIVGRKEGCCPDYAMASYKP